MTLEQKTTKTGAKWGSGGCGIGTEPERLSRTWTPEKMWTEKWDGLRTTFHISSEGAVRWRCYAVVDLHPTCDEGLKVSYIRNVVSAWKFEDDVFAQVEMRKGDERRKLRKWRIDASWKEGQLFTIPKNRRWRHLIIKSKNSIKAREGWDRSSIFQSQSLNKRRAAYNCMRGHLSILYVVKD